MFRRDYAAQGKSIHQWEKCGFEPRIRPYHVENTSSRPITEVKQHWAALVLGWVTAWEYAVLYSFLDFEKSLN
jgi:hypothetical protein